MHGLPLRDAELTAEGSTVSVAGDVGLESSVGAADGLVDGFVVGSSVGVGVGTTLGVGVGS